MLKGSISLLLFFSLPTSPGGRRTSQWIIGTPTACMSASCTTSIEGADRERTKRTRAGLQTRSPVDGGDTDRSSTVPARKRPVLRRRSGGSHATKHVSNIARLRTDGGLLDIGLHDGRRTVRRECPTSRSSSAVCRRRRSRCCTAINTWMPVPPLVRRRAQTRT